MKVAVIGAGIWGACSAYHLKKEGADVELYDMWGPGNARSGSGGASRIIRLAYGNDKIYTELTNKSFTFSLRSILILELPRNFIIYIFYNTFVILWLQI